MSQSWFMEAQQVPLSLGPAKNAGNANIKHWVISQISNHTSSTSRLTIPSHFYRERPTLDSSKQRLRSISLATPVISMNHTREFATSCTASYCIPYSKICYRIVVELRDERHLLVAQCRLPYQFTSVPKKKPLRSMSPQHTPGQHHPSHQPQNLPEPSISTQSTVPPGSEHQPHEEYIALTHIRPNGPQETNQNSAMLQRLAPSQGPVLGGFRILLSGINFPAPPTCIYAKFGSLVTWTVCTTARFTMDLETNPALSSGITHLHLNACCRLLLIQGWWKSPCPYIPTLKDPLSERVLAGSCTLLTANACESFAFGRRSS